MHIKGKTECFECQPRPAPKGFPICTIRNTPEKPVHCIVWAKDLLFERLFGPPDEANDLDEVTADDAHASEADKAADAGTSLSPASLQLISLLPFPRALRTSHALSEPPLCTSLSLSCPPWCSQHSPGISARSSHTRRRQRQHAAVPSPSPHHLPPNSPPPNP